ncbi:hypothetical protein QJS10_CPA01g02772 [Acorus calamus]|uniref:Uncharacterized protein n=1 Tax=Acorus calamus TaxID=4465 RepID=A0AAV9FQG3_ACOCL|nr:hypothetical protein QJS10_CPA01g02772 [Acorus calamus]
MHAGTPARTPTRAWVQRDGDVIPDHVSIVVPSQRSTLRRHFRRNYGLLHVHRVRSYSVPRRMLERVRSRVGISRALSGHLEMSLGVVAMCLVT